MDLGATRHICKDKSLFKRYESIEDGSVIYMKNWSTIPIKGKCTIDLDFTSGKVLSLKDVYHTLQVRKNLVYGNLLNKYEFKLVFESNKFVLTK